MRLLKHNILKFFMFSPITPRGEPDEIIGVVHNFVHWACRMYGGSLKSEESLPASADAQRPAVSVESLRRFASTTLNSRVEGFERLYSFEGFCLDVAGLWFPHMKKAGLRGVLQQTSGVAYMDVEGQKVQRSPTHFSSHLIRIPQRKLYLIRPTDNLFRKLHP